MKSFVKFRRFFLRYKKDYTWGLLLLLVTSALSLTIPLIIKFAVDSLSNPHLALSVLSNYALIIMGIAVVRAIIRTKSRLYLLGLSREIEVDIQNESFAHLQKLSPSFYAKMPTGDLMSRLINDIRAVRMMAGPGAMYFANAMFLYAMAFSSMAVIDGVLTLWALAPFPVIMVVIWRTTRPLYHQSQLAQEKLADLSAHLQENITGMHIVKSYVLERYHASRFKALSEEYKKLNLNIARTYGLFVPIMMSVEGLGILLILWKGGERVIAGDITLGDFAAFHTYLASLIWPTIALGWIINTLQRGASALTRIGEILQTEPTVRDAEPSSNIRWNPQGAIEFRNFSFSYEGRRALESVSFKAEGGTTIGVVGRVGSGKSTLLKSIPRLIEVPAGSIFIGGRDITTIPLFSLRKHIGYVAQDAFLFSASVKENIAFGRHDAPMEDIKFVSRISTFDGDIETFPQKYETIVGERGITLSGGQRQRATISRALLVEPDILVLDDSFSSVDAETERSILKELKNLRRERTTFIVSQRLSIIEDADWIVVLDDGRLLEQGRHDDLVKRGGLYGKLYQRQQLLDEIEKIK